MSDIIELIEEAYKEIGPFFALFELLNGIAGLADLKPLIDEYNLFYTHQITINEYLTRLVIRWFILPLITSVIAIIISKKVKQFLSGR